MAVMPGRDGGHLQQRGKSVIKARGILLAGAFVLAGATLRGQAPSAGAIAAPESWGTATGYTTVMGYELEGLHRTDLKRTIGATYCQAWLTHGEAAARLDLPEGASLNEFAFWAYDSDPSNWLTFNVYEACQPPGSGTPTTTLLASAETFGSPGTYYGAQQLNGHTVDNLRCSYSVRVTSRWIRPRAWGRPFRFRNSECPGPARSAPRPASRRSTTLRRITPSSSSSKRFPSPGSPADAGAATTVPIRR